MIVKSNVVMDERKR